MSAHYDTPREDDAATGEPPADFSNATPRPWRAGFNADEFDHAIYVGDVQIAAVWGSCEVIHTPSEAQANAALIVAAVNERGALHDLLADLLAFAKDAPPALQKRAADLLAGIEGDGQ